LGLGRWRRTNGSPNSVGCAAGVDRRRLGLLCKQNSCFLCTRSHCQAQPSDLGLAQRPPGSESTTSGDSGAPHARLLEGRRASDLRCISSVQRHRPAQRSRLVLTGGGVQTRKRGRTGSEKRQKGVERIRHQASEAPTRPSRPWTSSSSSSLTFLRCPRPSPLFGRS